MPDACLLDGDTPSHTQQIQVYWLSCVFSKRIFQKMLVFCVLRSSPLMIAMYALHSAGHP